MNWKNPAHTLKRYTLPPRNDIGWRSITRRSNEEVTRLFGKTMPANLVVAGIETD